MRKEVSAFYCQEAVFTLDILCSVNSLISVLSSKVPCHQSMSLTLCCPLRLVSAEIKITTIHYQDICVRLVGHHTLHSVRS